MDETRPLVKSATSEKQIRRAKRLQREAEDQWRSDLRVIVSTPVGRRVIWRLMIEGFIRDDVFASDPLLMANRAGRRGLMLWLEKELYLADHTAVATMRREADTDTQRRDVETAALATPAAADDEDAE
jgi:hypothetical protein